jgi:hypothetical protein
VKGWATAVLALGVTLLAVGCGNDQHSLLQPSPSLQDPGVGTVSAAAKARALAIVHRDPTVARLIGRGGVASVSASPWLPGDVNLRMRLKRAIDVKDVTLPYAIVPPDAPAKGDCRHPYARGWVRMSARTVTGMEILVDLHTRRVADVDVDGVDRSASAAPGLPHGSCDEIQTT